MTDTKTPKDDKSSAKDTQQSPTEKKSTQQKLEQLSKTIESSTSTPKASSMNNKSSTPHSSKNVTVAEKAKNVTVAEKAKISKTAIFALLVAIASGVGVGGIHYLHNLQNNTQSEELVRQLTALNNGSEQRIKQLLTNQKSAIDKQVNEAVDKINNTNQSRMTELEEELNNLKQNQPNDGLIQEAEYLVRIATRTMWLEHDTRTAIDLLKDADTRIKELDDPQYLSIRQIIRDDIEALKYYHQVYHLLYYVFRGRHYNHSLGDLHNYDSPNIN